MKGAVRISAYDVASKYFQLEEMEDKDKCVTQVFFAPDSTLTLMDTDGPAPNASSGEWEVSVDGAIKMTINRTFSAGQPEIQSTDVGEFAYEVKRQYLGQAEKIGGLTGFSGSIHRIDEEEPDAEVGYFELIDTTVAKKEDSGDVQRGI